MSQHPRACPLHRLTHLHCWYDTRGDALASPLLPRGSRVTHADFSGKAESGGSAAVWTAEFICSIHFYVTFQTGSEILLCNFLP